MDGLNTPLWERPVRWPAEGLPFDMRALRYVLAAAEQMSFSGAACALGMKVSSVSRHVRDFEDDLGISLFERTTSGVRLTDAGSRFLDDIIPVLQRAEAVLQRAGAAGRVEEGTVRVGIITTLAGGFLRELIASYRRCYPGVELDIQDGGRREHLRAIRARQLDIAIFTGNAPVAGCDVEEFWRERVHVAMAVHHPLASSNTLDWPQLRDERFIVSTMEPGPEVHDYIVRRVADYSTYPDVTSRQVTVETLMHMVAIGEGITLVSEGWTSMAHADLAMRPLTAAEDIVPFSAVWSPSSDNPALRRFLSFARDLAARQRLRRNQ
ncbi:MAG: LysR family transcriptional regulator [Aquamicrobium sp.]|uniref:LysR family transcriptional regulator n=1 Tax=Aquamicrobium sp. TaxID=1872579 RepID=UPI00349E5B20|nr:LysR family transcriptional regulator [Aquamicrobium sp.]MCO5158258.1 LysR family transcriptional regulator [Aquamicrobium sp.]